MLRQQQRFNITSAAYPESVSFSVATTAPHFLPHVVPWLSRFVFSLCNFEGSYRALCCRSLVSGILEPAFFANGEHEFESAQNERLKRTVYITEIGAARAVNCILLLGTLYRHLQTYSRNFSEVPLWLGQVPPSRVELIVVLF